MGRHESDTYARLSKCVSHALRHEPWTYELEVDEEGWVPIPQLLQSLRQQSAAWAQLSRDDLVRMIEASSKQRHELAGDRIRALYGHSLPGRLTMTPARPPACLYHGTSPSALPLILKEGLLPMGRQYVHLSVDVETAHQVGRRKDSHPLLLTVLAQDAYAAGIAFYVGNEKVWLADSVPPVYITAPQN